MDEYEEAERKRTALARLNNGTSLTDEYFRNRDRLSNLEYVKDEIEEIEEVADMMADIWMVNSNEDGSAITTHGLQEISEIFGETRPEVRANVFIKFLDILEEEGIEYDRSLMQTVQEVG